MCTASTTRPLKKGLAVCVTCVEQTPAEEWNVSLNKETIIEVYTAWTYVYNIYTVYMYTVD